ncbi:TPA: PRC-barrel domain containing protein [Candidatus Thalassarchaeaceae archaeon]|jgi:sporulation protein YlmC with PRC-barrel domain|nr:PRC-barrel domain-containing protein [Euryarchaeota archaeon]MDG1547958.1 PRC-barrel domain-containing protein [Candidatus Thalassarchaeaceae archaeon]DAC67110.1 MAG TPA: PRC-barrel domain containing protein [Candidatus Poseidoniales archaeon]MBT3847073.1 PRC-barrel domain-containing protein [Euryarchaeota archaeon]MBT4156504.1 PRC-barrel domain-containing protein [Euryarchaeota archaeon]|tara:strand:- start:313 stop:555 length:243 start_codon:yes stop_codon:yes gene_type:complete
MPVTFGREIVNLEVQDSAGDKLGNVADFRIDIGSGQITNILVMIETSINPQLLPWPTVNGLLSVPVEEIESVGKVIKLSE